VATEGGNLCEACGFSNRPNDPSCVKCGASLRSDARAAKQEGQSYTCEGVWRDSNLLVLAIGQSIKFPPRCVNCNASAEVTYIRRTLDYPSKLGRGLMRFVGVWMYTPYRFTMPFCHRHASVFKTWDFLAFWGLVIGFVIMMAGGYAGLTVLALLGLAGGLLGLAADTIKDLLMSTKARAQGRLWIRGVSPAYLSLLPEWGKQFEFGDRGA
jgi:hypothetical protein